MHQRRQVVRLLTVLAATTAITFLTATGPIADAIAAEEPRAHVLTPSESLVLDARAYAAEYDVNVREAVRRLRAQEQMASVIPLLKQSVQDRYAGLWIEHKPQFRLIVRLVGRAPVSGRLRASLAHSPIRVAFQTGATATHADLLEIVQASLAEFQSELPNLSGTDVDVRTGEIVLMVHAVGAAGEEARAKGVELGEKLGHRVRVDLIDAPEQNVDVRGGANLSTCTSGFVVANGAGTRGFLTSAHCGNTQSYFEFNGTSYATTFVSEIYDADQDVQWHTTAQTEVPQFYADLTTTARILTGRRLLSSTAVGNTVCHRGKTTGYSCGSVDSTTYQPTPAGGCNGFTCSSTYVRVIGSSLACSGGDSGGPWFNGQTAFGIMKTASFSGPAQGQCNFGTYMSTDYISGLGVSLVYG